MRRLGKQDGYIYSTSVRLVQLKCAVEAVSIAVNLTTLSSPAVLRDLTSLLLKCISAASIATSSFSGMSSSTKRSPSAQKGQCPFAVCIVYLTLIH